MRNRKLETLNDQIYWLAVDYINKPFADHTNQPTQARTLAVEFFIEQKPECTDTAAVRTYLQILHTKGFVDPHTPPVFDEKAQVSLSEPL